MSDASETHEVHDGTVLWYRPEKGQGAVKADNGRHFRFDETRDIHDIAKGLRVRVLVDGSTNPAHVVVTAQPGGRREFGVVEPPKPPPKTKATPATRKPRESTPKEPAGQGRRSSRRVASPMRQQANGTFAQGTTVRHAVHGQGFVVLSTRSVARVKFMPSGEERQVRTSDLESLESSK